MCVVGRVVGVGQFDGRTQQSDRGGEERQQTHYHVEVEVQGDPGLERAQRRHVAAGGSQVISGRENTRRGLLLLLLTAAAQPCGSCLEGGVVGRSSCYCLVLWSKASNAYMHRSKREPRTLARAHGDGSQAGAGRGLPCVRLRLLLLRTRPLEERPPPKAVAPADAEDGAQDDGVGHRLIELWKGGE